MKDACFFFPSVMIRRTLDLYRVDDSEPRVVHAKITPVSLRSYRLILTVAGIMESACTAKEPYKGCG